MFRLFLTDPHYKVLLEIPIYFNLDEFGKAVAAGASENRHTISYIQKRELPKHNAKINHVFGSSRLMLEYADSIDYAGHALWRDGSIKLMKAHKGDGVWTAAGPGYGPGREVLCYHRPEKDFNEFKTFPQLAPRLIEDMLRYGYFLPHWIPVITRFSCMSFNSDDWLEECTLYGGNKTQCGTGPPRPSPFFSKTCFNDYISKHKKRRDKAEK